MIVEQLQPVFSDTNQKWHKTQFFNRDAELVSRSFILLPDIVQVGVFGGIAREGIGNTLNLALIVNDEKVFRRYVGLVHEYLARETHHRDNRQVRLAAFDQVWSIQNPTWDHFHPERKLNLRESMDLVVLPFNWQNRIDELESTLEHASPLPLSEVIAVVTFIETQA